MNKEQNNMVYGHHFNSPFCRVAASMLILAQSRFRFIVFMISFGFIFILLNGFNKPPAQSDNAEKRENRQRKIYMITPTYKRSVRKAELTRLAQTLISVPNFHWIVVEDDNATDPIVQRLLERLKLNFTYLRQPTEKIDGAKAKGFSQRNKGLEYLRDLFPANSSAANNSIVYFGDDDNTYDLRLFDVMRDIDKIGVWPVAFCGGLLLEKQKINEADGTLINFDVWLSKHSDFRVDMAGFAVNLGFLLRAKSLPKFQHRGLIERAFLKQVTNTYKDIKPIEFYEEIVDENDNVINIVREALVWHTKTKPLDIRFEKNYSKELGHSSDFGWEV